MKEELTREIDIRELECPFCGFKKVEKVHDRIFNEETGQETGYGIDYWECKKCGAANDIDLDSFEHEFTAVRKFADNNDWKGLHEFCISNSYDMMMLVFLAKLYNQQRQFTRAIRLAELLLQLDPKEFEAPIIIKYAQRGIKNGRERK